MNNIPASSSEAVQHMQVAKIEAENLNTLTTVAKATSNIGIKYLRIGTEKEAVNVSVNYVNSDKFNTCLTYKDGEKKFDQDKVNENFEALNEYSRFRKEDAKPVTKDDLIEIDGEKYTPFAKKTIGKGDKEKTLYSLTPTLKVIVDKNQNKTFIRAMTGKVSTPGKFFKKMTFSFEVIDKKTFTQKYNKILEGEGFQKTLKSHENRIALDQKTIFTQTSKSKKAVLINVAKSVGYVVGGIISVGVLFDVLKDSVKENELIFEKHLYLGGTKRTFKKQALQETVKESQDKLQKTTKQATTIWGVISQYRKNEKIEKLKNKDFSTSSLKQLKKALKKIEKLKT